MTPEQIAEKEAATAAAKAEADAKAAAEAEPPQDPVAQELERTRASGRSEKEKAAFALKKNADRVRELGGDPAEILGGISPRADEPGDDAPVTVGMLKKLEAERASTTALQMADEITDPDERELTKHYLSTRIVPSGNPAEDLRFARAAVNSIKNGQIAEEASRATAPRTHSSGAGAPPKPAAGQFVPTAEEAAMMRPPFNLSKEKILAARTKAQE